MLCGVKLALAKRAWKRGFCPFVRQLKKKKTSIIQGNAVRKWTCFLTNTHTSSVSWQWLQNNRSPCLGRSLPISFGVSTNSTHSLGALTSTSADHVTALSTDPSVFTTASSFEVTSVLNAPVTTWKEILTKPYVIGWIVPTIHMKGLTLVPGNMTLFWKGVFTKLWS